MEGPASSPEAEVIALARELAAAQLPGEDGTAAAAGVERGASSNPFLAPVPDGATRAAQNVAVDATGPVSAAQPGTRAFLPFLGVTTASTVAAEYQTGLLVGGLPPDVAFRRDGPALSVNFDPVPEGVFRPPRDGDAAPSASPDVSPTEVLVYDPPAQERVPTSRWSRGKMACAAVVAIIVALVVSGTKGGDDDSSDDDGVARQLADVNGELILRGFDHEDFGQAQHKQFETALASQVSEFGVSQDMVGIDFVQAAIEYATNSSGAPSSSGRMLRQVPEVHGAGSRGRVPSGAQP